MVSPSKKRQIKGRVTSGHKIDRKGNYMAGQWCKKGGEEGIYDGGGGDSCGPSQPTPASLSLIRSHTPHSDQYALTSALM